MASYCLFLGELLYSLSSASPDFSLDPNTGIITTSKVLDREAVSSYTVTVFAADKSALPLSATALLQINVLDMNDNDPRVDSTTINVQVCYRYQSI